MKLQRWRPGMLVLCAFCLFTVGLLSLGLHPAGATPRTQAQCVPGPHSGLIAADEVWCLEDSPHLVNGNLTVQAGATVTVTAGVVVQASGNVVLDFLVQGRLIALGTPTQPITFTGATDSALGEWHGLSFDGAGGGPAEGQLAYVTVRNAGRRNSLSDALLGSGHKSALTARNAVLELAHVTVRDVYCEPWWCSGYEYGLIAADSQVSLTDTWFTTIGGGVYAESDVPIVLMGPQTTLTLDNVVLSGNANDRILLQPGAMMGQENAVLPAGAQMDGYEFRDDFTVPPTVTLTIEPGVALRGGIGWANVPHDFVVEGRLVALGTPTKLITFTSVPDSGPGQWNGLSFDGAGGGPAEGQFAHVTVRNAGGRNRVSDAVLGAHDRAAITVRQGTLSLEHSAIRDVQTNSWDKGLLLANGHATVHNTLFTGIGNGQKDNGINADTPIHVLGAAATLLLGDNLYVDNAPNMIKLAPGALTARDFTLHYQEGLDGYLCQEDFLVPHGITMTIAPGVTYRGDFEDELRVEGGLVALGTPERPITFTSFADTAPVQWSGLVFEGTAGQGIGHLRHATVRYGGHGNSVFEESGHGGFKGSNITARNVLTGALVLERVILERMYHFDGWHFFNDAGLFLDNSHAELHETILRDNGDFPEYDTAIHVRGSSRLLVRDSLIESNSGKGIEVLGDTAFVLVTGSRIVNNMADGVRNNGAATVILSASADSANNIQGNQGYGAAQTGQSGHIYATHNWWGDASGPTHVGNPGGSGQPVTDRVLYDPWLIAPPAPPSVEVRVVQTVTPQRVSVGSLVNLGIFFENVLTETLESVVVVLEIPPQSSYRFSSHGGQFWPEQNHVIWKLGDMAPGSSFSAVAQAQYLWGMPNGTLLIVEGMVAAANLQNEVLTYRQHLEYVETTAVSEHTLSQAEVATILTADPALDALYQHALGQGYAFYGNAIQRALSDGRSELELLLFDPARLGEMVALYRSDDERYLRVETGQAVSFYDLDGGAQFDLATAKWSFWGNRAGGGDGQIAACGVAGDMTSDCPDHDWGDCLRNCLMTKVPREMMNASRASGSSCQACQACSGDCRDVCSACARDMWKKDRSERYSDCTTTCMESQNWNSQQCQGNREECWRSQVNESKYSTSEYKLVYECDGASCRYGSTPKLYYCPHGCSHGDSLAGITTQCKELNCDGWNAIWNVDCHQAFTAKDPNALYGPLTAAPGQTLHYTIETENEGAAPAYDVFVRATLPPELDEGSLRMGQGGIYFPGSRAMFWMVGELESGAGTLLTFTVDLPPTAISGTVILAEAVVHFPSVPEITPTNPVVTLVQDVAAHDQTVQVAAGEPVSITLNGTSPSGSPLTYAIIEGPWQGSLSGAAPNLTYTPDPNARGQDSLRFTVHDGLRTSQPAAITILITPGVDTTPPQVIAVSPSAGARGVAVSALPLYGSFYPPLIWAQFNEPLDPATLAGNQATLAGSDGRPLTTTLAYDGGRYRLYLELHEPLAYSAVYTATLSGDLQDMAGNSMGMPYVWSFMTVAAPVHRVYLPLVLR